MSLAVIGWRLLNIDEQGLELQAVKILWLDHWALSLLFQIKHRLPSRSPRRHSPDFQITIDINSASVLRPLGLVVFLHRCQSFIFYADGKIQYNQFGLLRGTVIAIGDNSAQSPFASCPSVARQDSITHVATGAVPTVHRRYRMYPVPSHQGKYGFPPAPVLPSKTVFQALL